MESKYTRPNFTLNVDQLNVDTKILQTLNSIISTLSDVKFVDICKLDNQHDFWTQLKLVYGGDVHVKKSRAKILKGKYNDINMVEGDNTSQYD